MDRSLDDKVATITAAAKASLVAPTPEGARVPEDLRGRLFAASEALRAPLAAVLADEHVRVANVRVHGTDEWRGVRTKPELIRAVTRELEAASTLAEIDAAAGLVAPRLRSTGVYKDVRLFGEPAVDGQGAPMRGALDVVVELDESTYALNTGIFRTMDGRVETGLHGSLLNLTGRGERLSIETGATTGELNFGQLTDSLLMGGAGRAAAVAPVAAGAARRVVEMATPSWALNYTQPTIAGVLAPLTVRLRGDAEHHEMTSSFVNKVSEFEVSVSDPRRKHSLAYGCAWRNVVPVRHPTDLYRTASSPECVAPQKIAAEATASTKSSVTYAYVRDRLAGAPGAPAKGYKTTFRAELAGLGGDVAFAKAAAGHTAAWSYLRYAPDTGFEKPMDKAAFEAAAAAGAGTQPHAPAGAAGGQLRPHPGPACASKAASATAGVPTAPWGWRHRVRGWLAPGATLVLDGTLGVLAPLQSLAAAVGAAAAASAPPPRSLLVDRFFVLGSKMRGFDVVGPRAAPVDAGVPGGDALGGDVLACATARLLLPPPLPSVRLANAGVRTQLWATVGGLADGAALAAAAARRDPVAGVAAAAAGCSISAGVGLVLPLFEGASLEANYAAYHRAQRTDAAAGFRLQLIM